MISRRPHGVGCPLRGGFKADADVDEDGGAPWAKGSRSARSDEKKTMLVRRELIEENSNVVACRRIWKMLFCR